jgi:hypothetical protein
MNIFKMAIFLVVSAILNDQESQNRDLLASAYQDPNSGNIVIVVVNSSNQEATVNVETDGNIPSEPWHGYLTDSEHNLAHRELPSGDAIRIPGRSVMTLTTNKP